MCWRVRMGHTSKLTKYVANFVDELYCSGVHHVVISPGSRSTPLALLFSEHDGIKEWVLVDERSAAFFALGMARESNRSEEHTSELQSRGHLVCRLLLEKKKR